MANLNKALLISLTPDAIARFWEKVSRSNGCWEWTASKDGGGYGQFSLFGRGKSPAKSHRVSWSMHFGEIPEGLDVCHACDNPACVRPSHLMLGTHLANMLDASRKQRMDNPGKGKSGSLNNSAVLQEHHIPNIREQIKKGRSLTKIGAEFGVHRSTIRLIKIKHTWNTVNAKS